MTRIKTVAPHDLKRDSDILRAAAQDKRERATWPSHLHIYEGLMRGANELDRIADRLDRLENPLPDRKVHLNVVNSFSSLPSILSCAGEYYSIRLLEKKYTDLQRKYNELKRKDKGGVK